MPPHHWLPSLLPHIYFLLHAQMTSTILKYADNHMLSLLCTPDHLVVVTTPSPLAIMKMLSWLINIETLESLMEVVHSGISSTIVNIMCIFHVAQMVGLFWYQWWLDHRDGFASFHIIGSIGKNNLIATSTNVLVLSKNISRSYFTNVIYLPCSLVFIWICPVSSCGKPPSSTPSVVEPSILFSSNTLQRWFANKNDTKDVLTCI